MHVRLVTWDDDPPRGGQGVYVRELRSALQHRGIVVSTVAGRGEFAVAYPHVVGHEALDMSLWLNRNLTAVLSNSPDLLQISGGPGGLLLLRRVNVPVVYCAYHTYIQAHRWPSPRRSLGLLEARAYRLASRVAAISPSTADAVARLGVNPSRIVVIPPGVRPLPGTGSVDKEPGRMLFVGRLERDKGPLDAIAAMSLVIDSVPGATGYIVGEGSLDQEVAKTATDKSAGRVRYLGTLSDVELARQYQLAQVVLVPSRYEGLNLVALEARAAGAVVVGYDVTGLRDSIGRYGSLVQPGDVVALAKACARLLTNQKLLAERAAESTEAVLRDHSWEQCAKSFEDLYREASSDAFHR